MNISRISTLFPSVPSRDQQQQLQVLTTTCELLSTKARHLSIAGRFSAWEVEIDLDALYDKLGSMSICAILRALDTLADEGFLRCDDNYEEIKIGPGLLSHLISAAKQQYGIAAYRMPDGGRVNATSPERARQLWEIRNQKHIPA